MEKFPHLKFSHKLTGSPRFPRSGSNERSQYNRNNRGPHSDGLLNSARVVIDSWNNDISERDDDLAPLNPDINPVLIQLNPGLIGLPEFDLLKFNIEIVSEEDEGFIVAASLDNLRALEAKIRDFKTKEHGSGKIADFWQIIDGNRLDWKPQHILSETLYEIWHEIQDDQILQVEVGIAFDRPIPKEPTNKNGTLYQKYIANLEERDNLLLARHDEFEAFVSYYGKITNSFIDLEDSFSCQISITGKGLKDLVENYPFIFEVNELDETAIGTGLTKEIIYEEINIEPPSPEAPIVGIIDSGIQENHRLLEPAVDNRSLSYVKNDPSTADFVGGGGHGTRVAGAVLYPNGISSLPNPYQLPCTVRNLRILDRNNRLLELYPAELIQQIVHDNPDCSLFNLSVTSTQKYRNKHMSSWAAIIDAKIHNEDILFVISAGNLTRELISNRLLDGQQYPKYLDGASCKIANPGQSAFAVTVGSVNSTTFEDLDWISIGNEDDVSAFSRTGLGIWGMIKPDVVEYGGGIVSSKIELGIIKEAEETSPELVRSTLNGGPAVSKDCVGTSFAAPKVTNILSELKKIYPEESSNLLRALLISGARLPDRYFREMDLNGIQYLGYGIPSLDRVTTNSESRITFYNSGEIRAGEANVYVLQIPDALRNPADDFDILIEVTLTFTGNVRRTRQKLKSYLSNWLDWEASKIGESHNDFSQYILKELNGEETNYDQDHRKLLEPYNWTLSSKNNWGIVNGARRTNSTAQKDWAIIKSYQLSEQFSVAVRGHKGWDRNNPAIPYSLAVSIEVLGAPVPIYDMIRIENEIEIEV